MPKRTNPFQELVFLIHSRLKKGWEVKESTLLQDQITGEMREVDVALRATIGNYELIISVECRDHMRPADVTWVEGMSKKHECLATSKLVLWSRSGFTKAAISKAKALRIDTVSQATVLNLDWTRLARTLIDSFVQIVIPKFSPFIDIQESESGALRLDNVEASLIYDAQGNVVQSVPSIVDFMSKSTEVANALLDYAPKGSGDFYAEVCPPLPWFVDTPEGKRAPVLRVGIGVSTVVEKLALKSASAMVEERVATLATASMVAGQFRFYVEEAPDGSKPIKTASIRRM